MRYLIGFLLLVLCAVTHAQTQGGFGGGGFGFGFGGTPGQGPGSACVGQSTAGRYTFFVAYGGPAGQAKIIGMADRVNAAEAFVGIPSDLVAEMNHAVLTGSGSYKGKAVSFRADVWQTGLGPAQRVRLILTSSAGKEVKRVSQALDAGTGMPIMIMPGFPAMSTP